MPGLAELQRFRQFAKKLESSSLEIQFGGEKITTSIQEFRDTIENPPEIKAFPFFLALLVSVVEVIDLLELAAGWTGFYTFFYGLLRLFITAYLYIWAFNTLQGIKLIGVRRQLLKRTGRRILIAALSNAPIPYIGIILRLFPMDLFFVVMTHYDNSKAVQAIWAALGNPKSLSVTTNVIRTKRGPEPNTSVTTTSGGSSKKTE